MNDAILFQIIKGLQSYKNASDNRWALEIHEPTPTPLNDAPKKQRHRTINRHKLSTHAEQARKKIKFVKPINPEKEQEYENWRKEL